MFDDTNEHEDTKELNICSIDGWKNFLSTGEYAILSEYDDEVSYDDFFDMVEEKQKEDNPEDFKYNGNVGGYRFSFRDFS